jgi:hypothetical protein
MNLSRRSFVADSALLSLFPAFLAQPKLAEALSSVSSVPSPTNKPTLGETYWSTLYAGEAQHSRGAALKTPNEDRNPRFLHFNSKTGLRWAEDIKANELPDFDDDAVVTMEIGGFRAGALDNSKLAKVRFAQLHLSCQRVTGSEFVGPLAWAALATVFTDKASKLPPVKDVGWSAFEGTSQNSQTLPGAPQLHRVLLSHGAGHLSVNISTTPTTSVLDKVLGVAMQGAKIMTPLLGFPAISLPALSAFYNFYGSLEKANPGNFLLNTSLKDVAVTQKGADNSLISMNSLKLLTGDYVLVPKAHETDFEKEMDKMIVQNGYVVHRDSKVNPDDRIKEAVPAVSYITLSVKVQPASSYTSPTSVTDPLLDASPASTTPGSSGKTKKSHSK